MSLRRTYESKEINWVLVPNLLDKVTDEIISEYEEAQRGTLRIIRRFSIDTPSQHIDVDTSDEFLSLLKSVSEPLSKLSILLDIRPKESRGSLISHDFSIIVSGRELKLEFRKPSSSKALDLCHQIEEMLQLIPYQFSAEGAEQPRRQRTAFIAHAFDNTGRSYAFQLTKFLSLLGFEIATGEGFAPEKVSSKVRRRLLAQEIVFVVLSQKDNFTWLTQEATGADFAKKPLFILVEKEVEFSPGILGDLEYIQFPKDQITETFTPILEGLRELDFKFS